MIVIETTRKQPTRLPRMGGLRSTGPEKDGRRLILVGVRSQDLLQRQFTGCCDETSEVVVFNCAFWTLNYTLREKVFLETGKVNQDIELSSSTTSVRANGCAISLSFKYIESLTTFSCSE